jgi:hypothetical protein
LAFLGDPPLFPLTASSWFPPLFTYQPTCGFRRINSNTWKKWGYENNNNGQMTVMTYMGNGRIYEHACDIWVDANRFLGAWGFGCPKNPEWTLQSMEISPSNVGI